MWQLFVEEIVRQAERQAAKELGRRTASNMFNDELNKHEAYANRINREFNLRNYDKARAVYDSNPAYWEKLYGDDPVTSPRHPASPPKSLVPRQPGASVPAYSFLDPATTDANALGRFGTAGQFVPGSATSSRPLYEMQTSVLPPDSSAPPIVPGDNRPLRRLGVRIGDAPDATVFDTGAAGVPFVSLSPIPRPGGPAAFNERFPSLPPTSAPPGAVSPDELETFRRQWLKAFMEP